MPKNLDEAYLTGILTRAAQINGIIAIMAGGVAQIVAGHFGLVAPFDCAILFLLLTTLFVAQSWEEPSYLETSNVDVFKTSWKALIQDRDVLWLGLIQGLFEGSMYIFILDWTPILSQKDNDIDADATPSIPHGYIFSAFMTAVFLGSSLFDFIQKRISSLETILLVTLCLASGSFMTIIALKPHFWRNLSAFLVFEVCIGVFWPCLGILRGRVLPDGCRSTLMNFFRIPVNLIIITILLQDYSLTTNMLTCGVMLSLSAVFQSVNLFTKKRQSVTVRKTHPKISLLSIPEERVLLLPELAA